MCDLLCSPNASTQCKVTHQLPDAIDSFLQIILRYFKYFYYYESVLRFQCCMNFTGFYWQHEDSKCYDCGHWWEWFVQLFGRRAVVVSSAFSKQGLSIFPQCFGVHTVFSFWGFWHGGCKSHYYESIYLLIYHPCFLITKTLTRQMMCCRIKLEVSKPDQPFELYSCNECLKCIWQVFMFYNYFV